MGNYNNKSLRYFAVPIGWQSKRVDEIAPLQRGFDLPVEKIIDGKYPVVFSNGILKYHSEYKAKAPGVVTGRSGTIGKVTFVDKDYWPHNTALWVTDFKGNEPKYIYYFYEHFNLERFGSGSGVPTLNRNDVHNQKIIIPPLPEQKAIAHILGLMDEAINKNNKLLAQKELRKKWLMQNLLTGRKRLKGFEKTKWHLKSLEEVAEFKNGKAHENVIDENGKYIVVNSKFISSEGSVFKCSNENICPLKIDDIVMVMSDIPNGKAIAKCFYINENEKYTLNQRICSIRAYENTDSRFLFFILNRNVHYLGFDNGVSQTNLRKEEVLECPLIMPEKDEQTAIAHVFQTADKEIQLLKTKTEKLKEQKKWLMQVLLTGKKRVNI